MFTTPGTVDPGEPDDRGTATAASAGSSARHAAAPANTFVGERPGRSARRRGGPRATLAVAVLSRRLYLAVAEPAPLATAAEFVDLGWPAKPQLTAAA